MKNYCVCGRQEVFIRPYSALLLQQFFALVENSSYFYILCEQCGKDILMGYRDTYGIGI